MWIPRNESDLCAGKRGARNGTQADRPTSHHGDTHPSAKFRLAQAMQRNGDGLDEACILHGEVRRQIDEAPLWDDHLIRHAPVSADTQHDPRP
jgi:hypothetical protein